LTLIEVIRQARQYFVAHMRPRSGVLAGQADRVILGGNRRTQDRKMADQADDLSIPTNPVRPAAGVMVPPSRLPDLVRLGAEPPNAPNSLNRRVDQPVGLRDDAIEARKLIVGRGISLSGEITSCDRLVIEGSVEANLQNCQHVEITETGVFNGNAAIDDIEVSGRFEGDPSSASGY
jgi:Polymer-forming cytoskeletal